MLLHGLVFLIVSRLGLLILGHETPALSPAGAFCLLELVFAVVAHKLETVTRKSCDCVHHFLDPRTACAKPFDGAIYVDPIIGVSRVGAVTDRSCLFLFELVEDRLQCGAQFLALFLFIALVIHSYQLMIGRT